MKVAQRFASGFITKMPPLHAVRMKVKAEREARLVFSQLDRPPILIYQMGKVGSRTVYQSLKKTRLSTSILHIHFLSNDLPKHRERFKRAGVYPPPYHIYLGESVRKILSTNPNVPCKIISLVRDPIAFIVSGLFQNPHLATESVMIQNTIDPEKAIRYLECKLREPNTFSYMNEWFDRELKQMFDIDVFANRFPADVAYAVYGNKRAEALIIRLEDLSQRGPKAISDFLNLETTIVLEQSNVRNDLNSAESYHYVLRKICLNEPLCREIYSSKFVRHFYDDAMIDQFISKWTKAV